MTFFELLTIIACVASAYSVGAWLGAHYGVLGWVLGAIAGIGAFLLIYFIFRKFLIGRK